MKKESLSVMTVKTFLAVIIFAGIGTIIVGGGYIIGKYYKTLNNNQAIQQDTSEIVDFKVKGYSQTFSYESASMAMDCGFIDGKITSGEFQDKELIVFFPNHTTEKYPKKDEIIKIFITNKKTVLRNKFDKIYKREFSYYCLEDKDMDGEKKNNYAFQEIFAFKMPNEVKNTENKSFQFDECGKAEKYKELSWWNNFKSEVEKVDYYSEDIIQRKLELYRKAFKLSDELSYDEFCDVKPIYDICKPEKLKADTLSGCLALDDSFFVAMFPSSSYSPIGEGGYVFRYSIKKELLEEAQKIGDNTKNDWSDWGPLPNFLKETNGAIVYLSGSYGDSHSGKTNFFEYDCSENVIKFTKTCTHCSNSGMNNSCLNGLSNCKFFSTDKNDISNWQTYRNEEFGFEVKYPEEWTYINIGKKGVGFLPPGASEGIEYTGDIRIFVRENSQNLLMEDFYNGKNGSELFQDAQGGYTTIIVGGKSATKFEDVLGMVTSDIVVISLISEFIEIEASDNFEVYNQILSTFKFTQK